MTTIAESAIVGGMAETLIGTSEAARRCGVDRTTFFRWVQLHYIRPKVKLEGRTGAMLFDPAEVEAVAAKQAAKRAAAS